MQVAPLFAALFSVLVPAKMWFGVNQPNNVRIDSKDEVTLILTDFSGRPVSAKGSADVAGGATKDIKTIFPQLESIGTYVLYAVPKGKTITDFVGTPLVIEVRGEKEGKPAPTVTTVRPLQYAVTQTAKGPMTMIFYYDVAPLTVDSFLRLASEGYYDGLTFHRIVPGFVIQGGDPRGDGTGGPGYSLPAEFNDRPHREGVLSMARAQDPNSGGSQFFICLDYARTKMLDHNYTVFGTVTDGMIAVNDIARTPLANQQTGAPRDPQIIESVTVKPVTAQDNPYKKLFESK
jgi:cyclophilin family peptidyl-prolyl cis-trans isomerase